MNEVAGNFRKSLKSGYAIQKVIEEKHKTLPSNFRKLLSMNLKNFVEGNKLMKVKASFKLLAKNSGKPKKPIVKAVAKQKGDVSKPKIVAKTVAKQVLKPKGKPAVKGAVKVEKVKKVVGSVVEKKVAVKRKVESKSKDDKPAKVAKTAAGKKGSVPKAAEKAVTKKMVAKKTVTKKAVTKKVVPKSIPARKSNRV